MRHVFSSEMVPAKEMTEHASMRLRSIVYYTAKVIILIGIYTITAWHIQSQWLYDNLPFAYDSKYNTGLCLIALGLGLIASAQNAPRAMRMAAAIVLLISVPTILEYITQTSFGVDELIVTDIWYADAPHPGRMSVNSALCFIFMPAALLISSYHHIHKHLTLAINTIALAVAIISLVALAGYLSLESLLYSWDGYARMAPQTAVALLAWSIGTATHLRNAEKKAVNAPFWILWLLCLGVLWFDLSTPLGIAAGIGYIPLILCSRWFSNLKMPFVFAAISTVLIIIGHLYSLPSEQLTWVTLVNRTLTTAALWIVAVLVYLMRHDSLIRERAEIHLKSVLDTVLDGIITIDAHGTIQTFNSAAKRIFGYRPKEIIGKNVKMLMPEPYHTEHDGYLRNYLTTGEQKIIGLGREVSGKRKDGSVFPIELGVNEMPFGDARMFVGTVRDISERKATELALRNSEERYQLAVQVLSIGIWDWNVVTNQLYWSPRLKEILGIPLDNTEMHYSDFESRLHPDDKKRTLEAIQEHFDDNCPFDIEYPLRHNDGHYVHVHIMGQAKWDDDNQPIRMVGSLEDISERKQHETAQESLTRKLLESNTELERFAYIASHDMQEPIRMVTNFSEIIFKDYEHILDETGREYLKLVVNAGIRMRDLVDDLLAYSRVGNESMKMTTFSGENALTSVCENLQEFIKDRQAKITHDVLPELYGNPIQIMRVLQNLITNGIKYQPKDNIPRIHISVEDQGSHQCISVKDNGLGIKSEFIKQIFQPFRRLHTWDVIHGTGLGLSICKKIIENHNGDINATSEPDKGSMFSFTISKQLTDPTELV